jgi:hypothetical protein
VLICSHEISPENELANDMQSFLSELVLESITLETCLICLTKETSMVALEPLRYGKASSNITEIINPLTNMHATSIFAQVIFSE